MHYEPDCSAEQMDEVLRSLDRWSDRTAKHVTHRRVAERHAYRAVVMVEPVERRLLGPQRQIFHVPTRNISKRGIGILAAPQFMPRLSSDETPIVRGDSVFQEGAKVKIVLPAKNGNGATICGEIVRVRQVHFGFLDIGVRFVDREM
jgi:hypothetical protein